MIIMFLVVSFSLLSKYDLDCLRAQKIKNMEKFEVC